MTGDAAYLNIEQITGSWKRGCSLSLASNSRECVGAHLRWQLHNARRWVVSAQVPGNRIRSMAVEEFGHVGGGRRLAGELVDAESLEGQAQRALVLIKRLRLEIWFAVGADDHSGDLTSAMIEIA